MSYDLVLKNGWVIDGSGKERYLADVALRDGRIVAVGDLNERAKQKNWVIRFELLLKFFGFVFCFSRILQIFKFCCEGSNFLKTRFLS